MNDENELAESSSDLKNALAFGNTLKTIGGWVVAIVISIASVIFWIQAQGSDKFYPKLSGENLEKQLGRIEQKFDSLEDNNREILRLLGRLEASQEKRER